MRRAVLLLLVLCLLAEYGRCASGSSDDFNNDSPYSSGSDIADSPDDQSPLSEGDDDDTATPVYDSYNSRPPARRVPPSRHLPPPHSRSAPRSRSPPPRPSYHRKEVEAPPSSRKRSPSFDDEDNEPGSNTSTATSNSGGTATAFAVATAGGAAAGSGDGDDKVSTQTSGDLSAMQPLTTWAFNDQKGWCKPPLLSSGVILGLPLQLSDGTRTTVGKLRTCAEGQLLASSAFKTPASAVDIPDLAVPSGGGD